LLFNFPGGTRFGALAFAGGVLPDANLRGMRMFRSHGGTVPTVTGRNLRVRPLRPVRALPAGSGSPDVVLTRLQFWCFASAPLPRGRRQLVAGRWPRATGLTSYLLGCFRSCSRVTWFFTPPLGGDFTDLAKSALSPRSRFPCAPLSCGERGLLAGLARRVPRLRSGLRSSNQNPLG
jgi:hypothetical protein